MMVPKTIQKRLTRKRHILKWENAGGAAAASAGFFTNPLEVIKIRFQLQGELKDVKTHTKLYRNVFHAAYVIAKHDGIWGLQKGLVPALWIQILMNGTRLGIYQYFSSRGYDSNKQGNAVLHKKIILSGFSGVVGHCIATPLHLVKTRIMAKSVAEIAVGHQHDHEGAWHALQSIYKQSGIKGLFRGAVAAIPRAFVASASQLVSFYYCKSALEKIDSLKEQPFLKSLIGSFVGGVAISLVATPFDLVLIRLYNQGVNQVGRGVSYDGYFDCIRKIYRIEGVAAFYKGFVPMYFRLGPHTVLTLVFWDKFKEIQKNVSLKHPLL